MLLNRQPEKKQNQNELIMSDKRLFITSDQMAFFDEPAARQHARSLEDPAITCKTQEEIERENTIATAADQFGDEDFLPDSDF